MTSPTDLQTAASAVQWTNGRQLVTGAMVSGLFAIVIAILSGMGTWSPAGYTPNIPAGTITASMIAPGAIGASVGAASGAISGTLPGPLAIVPSGVTAASYGGPTQSLSITVGADGRLTAATAQPIAIVGSQVAGPLFDGVVTFATLPTSSSTPPVAKGERVFCSDCLKPGQSAGAGTGMPEFYDGTAWFSSAGTAAAH